jgi:hypothetical protein
MIIHLDHEQAYWTHAYMVIGSNSLRIKFVLLVILNMSKVIIIAIIIIICKNLLQSNTDFLT